MLDALDFEKKRNKILGVYPQTVGDEVIAIRNAALTVSPQARAYLAKFAKARYDITLARKWTAGADLRHGRGCPALSCRASALPFCDTRPISGWLNVTSIPAPSCAAGCAG